MELPVVFMAVLVLCSSAAYAQTAPSPSLTPTPAPAPAPEFVNLTELFSVAGPFNTFLSYLESTKVIETFQDQANKTEEGITIFVPKDSAFASLKKPSLSNLTADQLKSLFLFHALSHYYSLADFRNLSNMSPVATMAGGQYSLNFTDVSGTAHLTSGWSVTKVSSSVHSTDPVAVYQVDKVLLPEAIFGTDIPPTALVPSITGDNGDDQSSGSSNVTASNSSERGCKAGIQEPAVHNCQSFSPHQVPCFPGSPWPYPWNSPQWTSAMPPPAFFHSGFPISFYPAPPYWGCTGPGSWNVPCNSPPSSNLSHCGTSSGPNSPTLGKHPRDGDILNQASSQKEESSRDNRSDRCVLIPKTLRIDDPSEAAKSSIWETLGIKNEKGNSINEGGIFKSFESKGHEKRQVVEQSSVLQANPAAFSRSLNFREIS